MSAIKPDELQPGSVVHLSPDLLVKQGDCWTIARPGNEVKGDHMFLIAKIREDGTCLAAPLFRGDNADRDRVRLADEFKDGAEHDWRERESVHHYHKWQFWQFPVSSVEAASMRDNSSETDRRTYGSNKPSVIAALTSHLPRAREPWRQL